MKLHIPKENIKNLLQQMLCRKLNTEIAIEDFLFLEESVEISFIPKKDVKEKVSSNKEDTVQKIIDSNEPIYIEGLGEVVDYEH